MNQVLGVRTYTFCFLILLRSGSMKVLGFRKLTTIGIVSRYRTMIERHIIDDGLALGGSDSPQTLFA